jgi:predicted acylesterase/phospholipase RssA
VKEPEAVSSHNYACCESQNVAVLSYYGHNYPLSAAKEAVMKFDLVFEGGGAKGIVFVGALREFESRGHTYERLLGTSAGAITSTMVAAGYTVAEMLDALAEENDGKSVFTDFMSLPAPIPDNIINKGDISSILQRFNIPYFPDFLENGIKHSLLSYLGEDLPARHIVSFVELGGWFSADLFVEWFCGKMDSGSVGGKKRNFSKMTFEEFYQATGKDLTLCVTDTTWHMLLALNHRTAPQCPVTWGVRMSMSIPMLWQEVIWQADWGKYRDQDISGHSIVDGGVLSNFPIELFLSDLPTVTALMGPKTTDNILGLLIDETLPVEGADTAPKTKGGLDVANLKTVQRIGGLVNTMLEARDKSVITTFEKLVVRLPAKGYGTTEFDMSNERRNLLVTAGQKAMKEYFDLQNQAQGFLAEKPPTSQDIANQVATRMLR